MTEGRRFDIVIIGSGLGGAAALRTLVDTGLSVLVLERGEYVKQERENWEVGEVVVKRRYNAGDAWYDGEGKPFNPRAYYNVGGATKFYGGSALRLREGDFRARPLGGGTTVALSATVVPVVSGQSSYGLALSMTLPVGSYNLSIFYYDAAGTFKSQNATKPTVTVN